MIQVWVDEFGSQPASKVSLVGQDQQRGIMQIDLKRATPTLTPIGAGMSLQPIGSEVLGRNNLDNDSDWIIGSVNMPIF